MKVLVSSQAKNQPKRYLTAHWQILPVILLISVLVGCNRAPSIPTPSSSPLSSTPHPVSPSPLPVTQPVASSTSTAASELGVEESALPGVKVEFWYATTAGQEDYLQTLFSEFNRLNPWGITVQTKSFLDYQRLSESIEDAFFSPDLPSLALAFTEQAMRWDSAGQVLVDLMPYINDPLWGLEPGEQSDFFPLFWRQDMIRNKRLGIPFYRSAQVLFYNLSWARELGFETFPTTPDEFMVQACAAAKENEADGDRSKDGTGGWVANTDPLVQVSWLAAFGSEFLPANGQGYQFDTPEVQNAFRFQRRLLDRGCAWVSESVYPNREFAERKGLFIASSLSGIGDQTSAFSASGNADEWTVIPFPSTLSRPVLPVYGPSLVLFKSEPAEQLAAWLFIKWLTSTENQARWDQQQGVYPTRISTQNNLEGGIDANPQWAAALPLMEYATVIQPRISWSAVRLAIGDAAGELFSPRFNASQIPALVKSLDETAKELDDFYR